MQQQMPPIDRKILAATIILMTLGCGDSGNAETSETGSSTQAETTRDPEDSETSSPTTGDGPRCGDGVLDQGEECDEGAQNDASSNCLVSCELNVCGDGAPGPDEGCDDGSANADDALCKLDCTPNTCGDGSISKDAEECDDGNGLSGDGCDSECKQEPPGVCPVGTSILLNPGFEDGVLAPWTANGSGSVIDGNPHSGDWSVRVDGNFYVEQLFAATPVNNLVSARFWTWHDILDEPLMLVEWSYDDGTDDQYLTPENLDGWQEHDIIGELDLTKSLISLRIWGYKSTKPIPDVTVFDDFSFCQNGS